MKRILVLLSVVALMVVMLAMSVAPAFARTYTYFRCTSGSFVEYVSPNVAAQDYRPYGFECRLDKG
jgi:hypothetical protein